MADLDVVPKHRSNTWLWIVLAVIVIALLIWAFAGHTRTAAQRHSTYPAVAMLAAPPSHEATIEV